MSNNVLPSLENARKRDKEVSKKLSFSLDDKYKSIGNDKKYHIITHGCQANQRDSETMAGILDSLGYQSSDNTDDADVIIINTCAVRQGAEEKVLGEIGALKRLKKNNHDLIIGIGGCMAQEEETVNLIMDKYKQVDIIFGKGISKLGEIVGKFGATQVFLMKEQE